MLIGFVQWYAFRNCEKAKERKQKKMNKKKGKKLLKEAGKNKKELLNKVKGNKNEMQQPLMQGYPNQMMMMPNGQ